MNFTFFRSLSQFKIQLLDLFKGLLSDPLHRNSLFLMASTGVMAAIGFFFWILASRLYSPAEVGLGSSLISVGGLLVGISSLGFPVTLIRFLPKSTQPRQKISTAIFSTALAAIIVSISFWVISSFWLKEIHSLISVPLSWLLFTFAIILASWQQISESVFIAYKRAHWVLLQSLIFSLTKLLLVIPLLMTGGFGIFLSHFSGLGLAAVVGYGINAHKYHLRIVFEINKSILQTIGRYSAGSYFAGLINALPPQVLPALITQSLGAESAAHFFLALMMVNLVTIIPQASAQTLFAAASAEPGSLRAMTIKSIKAQLLLVSAPLAGLLIFGGVILSLFGPSYASDTTVVLRILSLSVIPAIVIQPLTTRLRIRKKLKALTLLTFLGAVGILVACLLGSKYGLEGVAIGYVIGQFFVSLLLLIEWKGLIR